MSLSSDSEDEQQLPGQQDEEWEEWDGDEEEDDATRSLFCDVVLPSPEAAFEYDATHYGFDIRQFKIERRLDDYDTIRVINFIRCEVAGGRDPLPALVASAQQQQGAAAAPWAGDEYLTPSLQDDPLITYDYDEQQLLLLAARQPWARPWAWALLPLLPRLTRSTLTRTAASTSTTKCSQTSRALRRTVTPLRSTLA